MRILFHHAKCMRYFIILHVKCMHYLIHHVKCMHYLIHHIKDMHILFRQVKCMRYFNLPCKMYHLILTPKSAIHYYPKTG